MKTSGNWQDRLMNAVKSDMANEQSAWPFRTETTREKLNRQMMAQMKHPLNYETVQLNGFHIMVVDEGTKVTDERSGQYVTIDDKTVATKGSVLFCTQKALDGLKALSRDR